MILTIELLHDGLRSGTRSFFNAIKLTYCSLRLPIAMQLTREDLKQDLDNLNPQQLQQVADFITFLQFRDRPGRVKTTTGAAIDPAKFAAIADFADDDRELAEMGMNDYATMISHASSLESTLDIVDLKLLPYVSDEEQAEIETQFGSPLDDDDKEWIDVTEWIKYGGQIPEVKL
jgi:hypothetical protein